MSDSGLPELNNAFNKMGRLSNMRNVNLPFNAAGEKKITE